MPDPQIEPVVLPPKVGDDGNPDLTGTPQTVSYETYKKVLDEKKRFQAKAEAATAEDEQRKKKDLESKGKYQEILDQKEADLKKATSELESVRRRETDRLKLSHLLDAIDGHVDPKFYKYIDHIDEIQVNPDTGEIDKISVSKAAEKFRAEYPEFIKAVKPGLPNGAPQGGLPGKISTGDWLKLSSKEMRNWKPHQITD